MQQLESIPHERHDQFSYDRESSTKDKFPDLYPMARGSNKLIQLQMNLTHDQSQNQQGAEMKRLPHFARGRRVSPLKNKSCAFCSQYKQQINRLQGLIKQYKRLIEENRLNELPALSMVVAENEDPYNPPFCYGQQPNSLANFVTPQAGHRQSESSGNPIIGLQQKQSSDPRYYAEPIWLFALTCVFVFYAAFQNYISYFMFNDTDEQMMVSGTVLMSVSGCIAVYFICESVYISSGVTELVLSYLMLDNILLTQIAAGIGLVGLASSYNPDVSESWYMFVLMICLNFSLGGNHRVLLRNVRWNWRRVIAYKGVVLGGAITYFAIGTKIMITGYKITQGFDPEKDDKFKDFSLLYTFANFAFFLELFVKVSDMDGSSDLKLSYSLNQKADSSGNSPHGLSNKPRNKNKIVPIVNLHKTKSRDESFETTVIKDRNNATTFKTEQPLF